jgi:transcriptional regulator with XRE-family HTH domain
VKTRIRISDLPKLLKEKREARGWTQEIVCHFVRVSRPSLAGYENGECLPSFEAGLKLMLLFGIEVKDFHLTSSSEVEPTPDRERGGM